MYSSSDNVECTMAIIPVKVRISGSNIALFTCFVLCREADVPAGCRRKAQWRIQGGGGQGGQDPP